MSTDLKRTSNLLRERELQLRMAQDAAKAGVWNLPLIDGGAWWSDECLRLHDLEPGSVEMTMKNWISRLHPNEPMQVEAAILEAATRHTPYKFETKIDLAAGGERHLMETGRAVYDQEGKAIQLTGRTEKGAGRIGIAAQEYEPVRQASFRHQTPAARDLAAGDKDLSEADGVRLEQALGNLLHNASKYTGANGHIELKAELLSLVNFRSWCGSETME
jgi:hypothetical protein